LIVAVLLMRIIHPDFILGDMKCSIVIFILFVSHTIFLHSDKPEIVTSKDRTFEVAEFSLDEKIGQLFIVGLYANQATAVSEGQLEDPIVYIEKLVEKFHIGGVLFKKQWDPVLVHYYAKHFQEMTKIPLFLCIDAEWGLNMRMSSVPRLPRNLTLGSVKNGDLIYQMGSEIGRQCRMLGINWNFSPVVDINSNPKNPIIGDRSFGCNKSEVSKRGQQMIKGLQAQGVIATAKHFPGHGDTETDSHTDLPLLNHSLKRLREEELVPFSDAIQAGVKSIMTAHLLVHAIDEKRPASLSYAATTSLLQSEMGFEQLIITDDLLMGAISKRYTPEEAALMAFQAGNDLILSSKDIESSIAVIKTAVENGTIPLVELDRRLLKILKVKEWLGHYENPPDKLDHSALFTEDTYQLKRNLYREAIHVLQDSKRLLPLEPMSLVSLLQIGGQGFTTFQKALEENCDVSFYYLPLHFTAKEKKICAEMLDLQKNSVIFLMGMTRSPLENFGVGEDTVAYINHLAAIQENVILVIFGNPIISSQFDSSISIILGYEEDPDAQEAASAILFR
jgi:beta-N-acetylhexosaminidase